MSSSKIKTYITPGSDVSALVDYIGSQLLADKNFLTSLGSAFTGTTITALTGSFGNVFATSGHFSNLSADNFVFPESETISNFNVTDTLTGANAYIKNLIGTDASIPNLQAPYLETQCITGVSAYFNQIAGNLDSSTANINSLSANLGHFNSLSYNNFSNDVLNQPINGFVSNPGVITPSDTILSSINKLDGNDALTYMKDVSISYPIVSQFLGYNGSDWVNATIPVGEGGAGVTLYLDDIPIVSGPTSNTTLFTLLKSPNVINPEQIVSVTTTAASTAVLFELYLFSALEVATIPGGDWTFVFWNAVNDISGGTISQMLFNVNRVIVEIGTVTTVDTGTTRTAMVSGATPFIPSDASITVGNSSYLQTPSGVFPITSYTSSSIVVITVPSSYTNEIGVPYYVHRILFQAPSAQITTTTPTSQQTKSSQSAFSVSTVDMLSLATFGINNTADTRIISYTQNGSSRYSQFHTPLPTYHNDLLGLQGGAANQYYHLTASQFAIDTRPATSTLDGYLLHNDWQAFNNKQTRFGVVSNISNFTASADTIYLVDTTSSAINVQLPPPTTGIQFVVKDSAFNSATNNINLVRYASEKIENVAGNYVFNSNGESILITSNGTDWFIISSSEDISVSITGVSAYFNTITGVNIYGPNLIVGQITGASAFFNTITGTTIFASAVSYAAIAANSAIFTTLTGTTVYAGTFYASDQSTLYSVTGNSMYMGTGTFQNISGMNLNIYGITGDNCFLNTSLSVNAITGSTEYLNWSSIGTLTGDSAFFTTITGGSIYTLSGIQPLVEGVILAADNFNNSKFSSNSSTTDSFQIISNSNGGGTGLFKVYNNISGSPLFEIEGTKDSSSLTSGALVVKGGLGVAKTITASSITGSSGYFTSITGAIINTGTLTTTSITGNTAFFTTITATSNITASSLAITGSLSLLSITGSDAFMMESIETNGSLQSGSLKTYNIYNSTGYVNVNINNFAGDVMTIGVNTWNSTGYNTSWTTETAGMGGGLAPHAYMFRISDNMSGIASYNSSYNSVWPGTHYISNNGGALWYPCTGIHAATDYNMNGGIAVSRDDSLWIGTITSTGLEGGIYRSMDGVNFNQVLSVPMTGTFLNSTFECCDISNDNQTVLVCTDSPQSSPNYHIPFYISRNSGITWKAVIPSATYDHYWISDTAISYDGQYMASLDRNGVFISLDYGNTWNLRGPYFGGFNKQIAMSSEGSFMYLCWTGGDLYNYSLDYGLTWISNPPALVGFTGIDCDETGRYVFLVEDGSTYLWFSNNFGKTFTQFSIPGMVPVVNYTDDLNVSSDGSSIMIFDGESTKLWFKTMTDRSAYTGNLTVNGIITGTSAFLTSISYSPATGSNWATPPTTIEGALDDVAFASNIASASATGVLSYSDWISFNNVTNNPHIIRVNSDGTGNFSSIVTAMNSITGASESTPYKIIVGPGVFTENTINFKSWVWIEGQHDECTVIQTSSPNQHVIIGADNAGISKLTINGATGIGYAGVFYQSTGSSSQKGFYVYDARYGNNHACSICDTTQGYTILFNQNCRVGQQYTFTYGWVCTGTNPGRNVILESTSTGGIRDPQPLEVFTCFGHSCEVLIQAVTVYASTVPLTGYLIHVGDGGTIRSDSLVAKFFNTALYVENLGSGPTLDCSSTTFFGCNYDIDIEHPGTKGTFEGACDSNKVTVNPSSNVAIVFDDNGASPIGQVVLGSILQGTNYSKLANLSKMVRVGSTVGWVEGGDVTSTGGLGVTITAGDGFIVSSIDSQVYEIPWQSTGITLIDGTSNYIYVEPVFGPTGTYGIVTSSLSQPVLDEVVYLGRAFSTSGSIEYITASMVDMNQHGDRVENFNRNALGPIYVTGSTVTEDATPFSLDVTAGQYYYGTVLYSPSGASPITMSIRYRGTGGSWVYTTGTGVDNSHYDDGSGTLANMSGSWYAKPSLYTVGEGVNETYILFYAQSQYSSKILAEGAGLPTPSPDIINSVTLIATPIVQQGATNITEILDERPRIGFKAGGVTASADHTQLLNLNLGNAGHNQFMMLNGSTPMASNLNMSSNSITNISTANGVVIEAHETRHLPNGLDALVTASPTTNLSPFTPNAVGSQNSLSRSDHSHAIVGFQIIGSQVTGTSGYFSDVLTLSGGVTGGSSYFSTVTGISSYFTSITGINVSSLQLTGQSAFFTSITGYNVYATQLTGQSAFFTSITGSIVTSTSAFFTAITGVSITGDSAFFTSITGTSLISGSSYTGSSAYFTNASASAITSSTISSVSDTSIFNHSQGINTNSLITSIMYDPTNLSFNKEIPLGSSYLGAFVAMSLDQKNIYIANPTNTSNIVSHNGGITWSSPIYNGPSTSSDGDVSCSPDGKYVLTYESTDNYVVVSSNYGSSFSASTLGSNNRTANSVSVSGTGKYMSILFSHTFAGSPLCAIVKSSDYGNTWGTTIGGPTTSSLTHGCSITSSYNGQYWLVVNGYNGTGYVSTNYGANYGMTGYNSEGVVSYDCCMSWSGKYMYIVGGLISPSTLVYSTNYGSSWTTKSLGNTYLTIRCDPTGQNVVIANNIGILNLISASNNYGSSFSTIPTTSLSVSGIYLSTDAAYLYVVATTGGTSYLDVYTSGSVTSNTSTSLLEFQGYTTLNGYTSIQNVTGDSALFTSMTGSTLALSSTTASTSTTTGALVVAGGVGIGGTLQGLSANIPSIYTNSLNADNINLSSGINISSINTGGWTTYGILGSISAFIPSASDNFLSGGHIGMTNITTSATTIYYEGNLGSWTTLTVGGSYVINGGICIGKSDQYWLATYVAAAGSGGGIYVSSNYGVSFTQCLSVTWYYSNALCISGSNKVMYACCIGGSNNLIVYVSTNYGVSWANVSPVVTETMAFGVCCSYNGQYVSVIGGGVFATSSNYGSSWTIQSFSWSGGNAKTSCSMSADGKYQYNGLMNAQAFNVSTDYGITWTPNVNVSYQNQNPSCDASGKVVLLTPWYVNVSVYISTDYGTTFTAIASALGYGECYFGLINSDGTSFFYNSSSNIKYNTAQRVIPGQCSTSVGQLYSSKIYANGAVASTSTTTGALTVAGGVGIGGAVNIGGNVVVGTQYGSSGFRCQIATTSTVTDCLNVVSPDGSQLFIIPHAGGAMYNGLMQTGDQGIVFGGAGGSYGVAVGLTLTPWLNAGTSGLRIAGNGNVTTPNTFYCGALYVNGASKTFVIDNPIDKNKYLIHACLEGPTTDVFYRGESQLRNGTVNIKLPEYFEKLTEKNNRTILLTHIEGFDKLAVKKGGVKNGTFTVYSDNPKSDQEFYWEVKAIRKDCRYNVEPYKNEIDVFGDGPYKYFK
jgi:hypothetical protein